jgi:hypothetical protein
VILGKVTSFNIGTPVVPRFYVITAYDFANNESDESNVVMYTPEASNSANSSGDPAPNNPFAAPPPAPESAPPTAEVPTRDNPSGGDSGFSSCPTYGCR